MSKREWRRDGLLILEGHGAETRAIAGLSHYKGWKETADLIVRAVNCHEELLAACKAALGFIERQYVGSDNVAPQLRAAIALAEGK